MGWRWLDRYIVPSGPNPSTWKRSRFPLNSIGSSLTVVCSPSPMTTASMQGCCIISSGAVVGWGPPTNTGQPCSLANLHAANPSPSIRVDIPTPTTSGLKRCNCSMVLSSGWRFVADLDLTFSSCCTYAASNAIPIGKSQRGIKRDIGAALLPIVTSHFVAQRKTALSLCRDE